MASSADPTADQSQSTKPIKNSRLDAVVPQNRDTNCRYEVRLECRKHPGIQSRQQPLYIRIAKSAYR
jgi:hypothetical protein